MRRLEPIRKDAGSSTLEAPSAFQQDIDRAIRDLASPQRLIPRIVALAVGQRQLDLTPSELEQLSRALINSSDGILTLDLEVPSGFGASKPEIQENIQAIVASLPSLLEAAADELVRTVSIAVPEALEVCAAEISDALSRSSAQRTAELSKISSDKAALVARTLGPALERLDSLRYQILEWADHAQHARVGGFSNQITATALKELIERGSEVSGEIVALIRQGYAEGALARWRTLHEICVVAIFLARRSSSCAEMYLLHHHIERMRLIESDISTSSFQASSNVRNPYYHDLKRRCEALVARFGSAFNTDYGWAAVELARSRVTFRELETDVGLDMLRQAYKHANGAVHGGSLATIASLRREHSTIEQRPFFDQSGSEIAARNTVASLVMLAAEIGRDCHDVGVLALTMVVRNSGKEVNNLLERAQTRTAANMRRANAPRRKKLLRAALSLRHQKPRA